MHYQRADAQKVRSTLPDYVRLNPGQDSGKVDSRLEDFEDARVWSMIAPNAQWQRIAPDSLRITFALDLTSGNRIEFRFAPEGHRISGTVTYHLESIRDFSESLFGDSISCEDIWLF